MFSIFNIKKKSYDRLNVQEHTPSTSSTIADENYEEKEENTTDNNIVCDVLDLGNLSTGPRQPILKEYPKKKFGNQNRGFTSSYFSEFNWLEYSIKKDSVFCFPCRIFATACQTEDTFTVTGFNNWKKNEMLEFSTKHEISLEIPLQSVSRKRLRKESSQLKGFVCSSTTSASDDHIVETKKVYWKKKAYYCILDTIINILKIRFSEESLQVASSVDNLLKLNFEGSSFLVDHYKDLFGIADQSLKSEMSVLRNILGENPNLEQIKQHLALYIGKVFPNFSKMFQVAITIPVSTATCGRSFSAMRRIKTWLRTCMIQDRFSNLSILNIENDISINNEDILNIFEKTERRIQLH